MSLLTQTREKPPTWLLATRLVKLQVESAVHRMARSAGLRRAVDLRDDDLLIPDSAIAKRAIELVMEVSPLFLTNHGFRSFVFGAALGRREGLKFDRELLFFAAIMHDLGLTRRFDGPDPFELQGARAARAFLVLEGEGEARTDLVHEAIALHASVGDATRGAPEVKLCHYGTGVDVAGLRIYEFERRDVTRVVDAWPREKFKEGFVPLLEDQVARKPHCNIAGLVGLGFCGMIKKAPFGE